MSVVPPLAPIHPFLYVPLVLEQPSPLFPYAHRPLKCAASLTVPQLFLYLIE